MERKKLTREQVEETVRQARERGERPDLSETDLVYVNLGRADLSKSNLSGVNLSGANLSETDLNGADLSRANLSRANLSGTNLGGANLNRANLNRANLGQANLRGANLGGVNLSGVYLRVEDLSGAYLNRANLQGVNLSGINLSGAYLNRADLRRANLTQANLQGAHLSEANLSEASLNEADLTGADLGGATLIQTALDNTNFTNTIMDRTSFIEVDLSQAKGLAEVKHIKSSIIDINTIYRSKGKIPKVFLEKAGVHPDIIRWQHSLHARPTVFISYSHKDEKEKDELLTHLRALEREDLITIWHDELIKVGTEWKQEIKQAIAQATVALLLITPNFLASDFIQDEEIPEFLKRRESEEELVIFPVIAKHCAWKRLEWLAKIQVRPKGGQPVWDKSQDKDIDAELTNISEEVIEIIRSRWLR